MKRFFLFIVVCIISLSAYTHNFDTYAFGAGYSHFNETHVSDVYKFKNDQVQIFGVVYGFYADISFGVKQWSNSDGMELSTIGCDFGYVFPLKRKTYYGPHINFYIGPVIGFQRVGSWQDAPWEDYIDQWGDYHHGEEFMCENAYFNCGGVFAFSYNRLWMQAKFTRSTCGIGIGMKF